MYEKTCTQYLAHRTQAGVTKNFEFWKISLPRLALVEFRNSDVLI